MVKKRRGRPQQYVTRKLKLWPRNLDFLRSEAERRGIPQAELARRVFDHAEICPIFAGGTDAQIAPTPHD